MWGEKTYCNLHVFYLRIDFEIQTGRFVHLYWTQMSLSDPRDFKAGVSNAKPADRHKC